MPESLYEIMAYVMRYVFAALMVLVILPRATKTVLKDLHKTRRLRRMMPDTGVIGEFLVTAGRGWARTGMRYPIIREGRIGRSSKADVCIHHRSVYRRHADFEWDRDTHTLQIKCIAFAKVRSIYDDGFCARMVLHDGDEFAIGDVHLQLVLSEAFEEPPTRRRPKRSAEPKHNPIEAAPGLETDDMFEVHDEYDAYDDDGDDDDYDREA